MFDIRRFSKSQQQSIKEDTAALSLDYSFKNPTNENESFFVETCDFLSKMDQELYDQNKAFYGALCESGGNEVLIQESFSEWVDYAKKIIHKIVDFLKALLNKFLVGINMLIKREGYLKNHEKDFSKFKEEHNFHMNCYEFTIEDKNIPSDDVLTDFNKMLDNIYGDMDPNGDGKEAPHTAAGVRTAYDSFLNTIEDVYYDKIRAKVLGLESGTVSAGDYSTDLFEAFRGGSSAKDDTEITHAIVNDSLLHFKNYHKTKSDLEKRRKNIEKEYNNISKSIEQSISKNDKVKTFSGYKYGENASNKNVAKMNFDKDVADNYELWVKSVANAVHEISSIHTMAFSARLDALKDRFSQDKTILYKALYRILGNIRNGVREDADMSEWLGIEEIGNTDKGQKLMNRARMIASGSGDMSKGKTKEDYNRRAEKIDKKATDQRNKHNLRYPEYSSGTADAAEKRVAKDKASNKGGNK